MSRTIWSTLRTLATSSRVNALSSLDAIVVEKEKCGVKYMQTQAIAIGNRRQHVIICTFRLKLDAGATMPPDDHDDCC